MPSGNLTLHATSGDLTVGGVLDADGTAQVFYDQIKYTSAGEISLIADHGSVVLGADAAVSVAAASLAGNAGSLIVSAPNGDFIDNGTLAGSAGLVGAGGSFSLDVARLPSLAAMDTMLNASGFDLSRSFRARTGNVAVDGDAVAHSYSVTADSGAITVTGTIDASGTNGGGIGLYAYNGVTLLNGALLTVAAQTADSAGKGGVVDIETGEPKLVNGSFVVGQGWLDIRSGATIDLSVADGSAGGTLHLRAPQITVDPITGAVTYSAVQTNMSGATQFGTDLAIKPIAGTIRWTPGSTIIAEGFQVFDLTGTGGAINSSVENAVNTNGRDFAGYPGLTANNTAAIDARLLGSNSGLASILHVDPGAELVTSSGDITLPQHSDWNFYQYRYGPNAFASIAGSGEPGILTIRAPGNINLLSSLTDGFMPTDVWTTQDGDFPNDPTTDRWLDILLPAGSQSWSFRLAAGADLSSVNFRNVVAGSSGSVKLGVAGTSAQLQGTGFSESVLSTYYQVIRTGTGDIDVVAASDVLLQNPFASIYTAGSQVNPLPTSSIPWAYASVSG